MPPDAAEATPGPAADWNEMLPPMRTCDPLPVQPPTSQMRGRSTSAAQEGVLPTSDGVPVAGSLPSQSLPLHQPPMCLPHAEAP